MMQGHYNYNAMQQLEETGKLFIERIKETYDRKNITDQGGAKESLSYKVEGNKLIIEGKARIMFNEFGRRAGGAPPFDVIEAWVKRKLKPAEEDVYIITKTIVKNIAEKGTLALTNKAKSLELDLVFSELSNDLQEKIIDMETMSITDGLIKTWKK